MSMGFSLSPPYVPPPAEVPAEGITADTDMETADTTLITADSF